MLAMYFKKIHSVIPDMQIIFKMYTVKNTEIIERSVTTHCIFYQYSLFLSSERVLCLTKGAVLRKSRLRNNPTKGVRVMYKTVAVDRNRANC